MKKLLIFVLVSSFSAAHAVVLIDDFTSGLSTLVDTTTTLNIASYQSGLSNYGGTRTHFLSQTAAPFNGASTSEVNGGFYGSNTPQSSSQTSLYWGAVGITNDQQSLFITDQDYNFSANRVFRVYVSAASANSTFSIQLRDSGPNLPVKLATDVITIGSDITTPTVLTFDFTNTPTQLDSGFNFGAVDYIRLRVTSPASGGYAITRVDAVPEPATMSALLLGAGMLVRRRRTGK